MQTRLWHGLPTVPVFRPKVSLSIAHTLRETFGQVRVVLKRLRNNETPGAFVMPPCPHALITPIGRILATHFHSPARSTTDTTSSTSLYALDCSSAKPLQLCARAMTPRASSSLSIRRPAAAFPGCRPPVREPHSAYLQIP